MAIESVPITRIRVQHRGGGKSRVKASEAASTDINRLVDRWVTHGVPIPQVGQEPKYGDFSGTTDYHQAVTAMKEAEADFLALPAEIRRHCQQDLGVFLEKVNTPEGHRELLDLGLEETRAPASAPPPSDPDPPLQPEGASAGESGGGVS